jgi:hypothetical protein
MAESPQPEREAAVDPTLQFFLLCDNIASAGTKPVFVGVFDQILRPGPIPQFVIALRWVNGFGTHTAQIRILDPDLTEVGRFDGGFELQHRAAQATLVFGVINFVFATAGVYWFEILLDGKQVTSIPLPVQKGT